MSCCAAVTIIASAPFQGHARPKQNKHGYSEQILKSASNFSLKSASIYNIWIRLELVLFSRLQKENEDLVLQIHVRSTPLTAYYC